MNYGSQGVFTEGWTFDFRQEERVITQKHAEGERCKSRKTKSSVCECCGKQFAITKWAAGRFCSIDCSQNLLKRKNLYWYQCSTCMAKLGIGMGVASRILGVAKHRIGKQWRRNGIKAQLPYGVDSWLQYAKRAGAFSYTPKVWWGSWGVEWMRDYNPRFFDWSCLATYEINKKRGREYQSMMHRTSPKSSNFRLKKIARCRIYNAVKRSTNMVKPRLRYRTEKMIGCTVEQLRDHLQSKFKRGMTWDNHGEGWHIDHIIPMSHFDLANEDQLLASCHYTNMQPMWAEDNLKKSDNLTCDTQMQLRICATH